MVVTNEGKRGAGGTARMQWLQRAAQASAAAVSRELQDSI